jgi:diadenosine tetraphosphatase ApaH/serine/threonine PP2A family protein phosphatase
MTDHLVDRLFAGFEGILFHGEDILAVGTTIPIPIFAAEDIIPLCSAAAELFKSQSIVLRLDCELCVVGDVHGSLHDLLRIFRIHGLAKAYLFMGDYVDRGQFSLECILLLFTLAVKYPSQFTLLRGNHEVRSVAENYGFKQEIISDYPETVFDAFCEAFAWLPLAAVVQNRYFCVHGGIGPGIHIVDQIEAIERPIFGASMSTDVVMLLWADPVEQPIYFMGSRRGAGVQFGALAVRDFLQQNSLKAIVRAHQMADGVSLSKLAPVVTVFSASNYNPEMANQSGVLLIAEDGIANPQCYPPIERITRESALFFSVRRPEQTLIPHSLTLQLTALGLGTALGLRLSSGQMSLKKMWSFRSKFPSMTSLRPLKV